MTMRINTIIFDADHTLYTPESEDAYDAKFRFLSKETGKSAAALRRAWEHIETERMQSQDPGVWERKRRIKETLAKVGARTDEDLIAEAYTLFWETVVNRTNAPDGISRMLRQLRRDGYRLALATDEFPEPVRMKLAGVLHTSDPEDYFDMIVTCRDVGKQKPSKTYYTLITDEFGVLADDCMVVGDSWIRDLQPAQKLGMKTVLVGSSDPAGTPDHHIRTVTDLDLVLEDDPK